MPSSPETDDRLFVTAETAPFSKKGLQGLSVAHGRPTGKPTAEGSETMMCAGRPASLACSGDRRLKRGHGTRDHLLALSRPSRRAAVGWKALMP